MVMLCPEGSKINVLGVYGVEALCPGGGYLDMRHQ